MHIWHSYHWHGSCRTRKAALAGEVLFDDTQQDEQRQQGSKEDFEDAKPLAEELIDTLVDLLFFADFTLPRPATGKSKVSYAIWQSGVGCNTPVGTSKEFENNRCEILRLLLTLTSKVIWMENHLLPKSLYLLMHLVNVYECKHAASTWCESYHIYCNVSRQASCAFYSLFSAKYCKSLYRFYLVYFFLTLCRH